MPIHVDELYRRTRDVALAARHPLLVAHRRPDGDTLGAMLAFGRWLENQGKVHTRFCVDGVPAAYRFMPGADQVTADQERVKAIMPDIVFFFDAADVKMTGIEELLAALPNAKLVNVDHHVSNTAFGHVNLIVTDASSTAEVIHRFHEAIGESVDRATATCLLTGICTDTSHFSNPATTTQALRVGSALLSRGAKFGDVMTHIFNNKSVAVLKLWGVALSRLTVNRTFGIATTALTRADYAEAGVGEDESTEGISNFLNAVLDVPTVLVLKEGKDGMVRGSLRTTGERDVAKLAGYFGGGGHKKAAGFAVPGRLVEEGGRWRVVAV